MAQVADQTIQSDHEKEAPREAKQRKNRAGLPASPTGTDSVSPEQFVSYIKALDPGHWARLNFYVYQLEPAIIKPKPSYIDKPPGPIDPEYMLARHGSGKYQLKLNDADGSGTLLKCFMKLDDPERPNKFLSGSLLQFLNVKDDGNRQLVEKLQAEGRLTQEGIVIEQKAAESETTALAQALERIALKAMDNKAGGSPGAQDAGYQKSLGMIADASSESLKIVMDRLKTENKGSDLAVIMPLLIALIGQKNTPAPAQDNGTLTVLTKMLEAAEKRAEAAETRAAEERKEAAAERQRQHERDLKAMELRGDPMDMVEKVMNLKEKLGSDPPDNRKWPEKLVDELAPQVPELIKLGQQALTAFSYRPPAAQVRQPQTAPPSPPRPETQRPSETPAAATPSNEETMSDSQKPQLDPDVAELRNYLLEHGRMITNFYRNDPDGHSFAEFFLRLTNEAAFRKMQTIGALKIMIAIQQVPEMFVDLCGNPPTPAGAQALEAFINEFVAGPLDDDDDEEEEEPITAAPAAPAPKKKGKEAAANRA